MPIQGIFDLVRSGVSYQLEPLAHAIDTVADKEGEVNFSIPYAVAPNVELTGPASGAVIIVESRPASFKWKNVPQTGPFVVNSGSVSWKAKGVRATEIQQTKPQ
jgi:hypothetical protein